MISDPSKEDKLQPEISLRSLTVIYGDFALRRENKALFMLQAAAWGGGSAHCNKESDYNSFLHFK